MDACPAKCLTTVETLNHVWCQWNTSVYCRCCFYMQKPRVTDLLATQGKIPKERENGISPLSQYGMLPLTFKFSMAQKSLLQGPLMLSLPSTFSQTLPPRKLTFHNSSPWSLRIQPTGGNPHTHTSSTYKMPSLGMFMWSQLLTLFGELTIGPWSFW